MAIKTQSIINKHDDDITLLSICLQTLLARSKTAVTPATDGCKLLSRESGLSRIENMVSTPPDTRIEPSLLKQCQDQRCDYRKNLFVLYDNLQATDVTDEDKQLVLHSKLEKLLFVISHMTKNDSRQPSVESSSSAADSIGVKLPKLDVPTFDGNIHWKRFREQFTVSVHNISNLSNAEKICLLAACIKLAPRKIQLRAFPTLTIITTKLSNAWKPSTIGHASFTIPMYRDWWSLTLNR